MDGIIGAHCAAFVFACLLDHGSMPPETWSPQVLYSWELAHTTAQ